MHVLSQIVTFFKDDSGVAVVEYGLIVALVAVAVITALTLMGGSLSNFLTATDTSLNTIATAAGE